MPNLANLDYVRRINRAIDFVQRNLDQRLLLDDVARVAAFSSCHFHRIFKAVVGETLNAFVKRVRLERALYLLSHRGHPALTDVALACGFASTSDFSRSFRQHYGVSPRGFDLEAFRLAQRHRMQAALSPPEERHLLAHVPSHANPDGFAVRLVQRPPRRVAYILVQRPFEPGRVPASAARLVAWAQARGLGEGQWLGYMWDEPEIVRLEHCLYYVGVEVPRETPTDGEVGATDFPAMTLATIGIAGPIDLEQRAIDWLYSAWLPTSGFVPDHVPAFEAWQGLPFAHGDAHFELAVQLAVVDASTPL